MGDSFLAEVHLATSGRRKFPTIRRFVEHPVFGLTVVMLILFSVALLVIESMDLVSSTYIYWIDTANDAITIIFFVELFLRWLVSRTNRNFFSEFWLDILSLLPLLRVFRLGRAFRFVRILRVFSFALFFQRRVNFLGKIVEGRAVEALILCGFMGFALIFGTIGFVQFEVGPGHPLKTPVDAFWKALFSLLSNQYADYPETFGGRVILLVMSMLGVGVFAMLTGTVSALMIEKLKENSMQSNVSTEELHGHLVICGFSNKVAILVDEFDRDLHTRDMDIVLVSALASIESLRSYNIRPERLILVTEDFTRVETLRKAGIERARVAIILSEAGVNRSTGDIDARTMLAALTIEKLSPDVRTCAEMYHSEYTEHLKTGGVDSVVIQGEFSGSLLAHSAVDEGTVPFIRDLISPGHKNGLFLVELPGELVGKSLQEALNVIFLKNHSLVVGIKEEGGNLIVNPLDRTLKKGDRLLLIKPNSF